MVGKYYIDIFHQLLEYGLLVVGIYRESRNYRPYFIVGNPFPRMRLEEGYMIIVLDYKVDNTGDNFSNNEIKANESNNNLLKEDNK
jgi:hypothetical protein